MERYEVPRNVNAIHKRGVEASLLHGDVRDRLEEADRVGEMRAAEGMRA